MKNILMILFVCMFMLTIVNAEDTQPQKEDYTLVITSNNATSCNISAIKYPDGSMKVMNLALTKNGNMFYRTIKANNYTQIGSVCHFIVCKQGTNTEDGSKCINVTPSGFKDTLGFYILIVGIVSLVILMGFSIKEVWFVVIGGMSLIILGIYSINYGIAGFKDMFLTWGMGLFEIGIGTILSVGAAFQKLDLD